LERIRARNLDTHNVRHGGRRRPPGRSLTRLLAVSESVESTLFVPRKVAPLHCHCYPCFRLHYYYYLLTYKEVESSISIYLSLLQIHHHTAAGHTSRLHPSIRLSFRLSIRRFCLPSRASILHYSIILSFYHSPIHLSINHLSIYPSTTPPIQPNVVHPTWCPTPPHLTTSNLNPSQSIFTLNLFSLTRVVFSNRRLICPR
jgi:hypothetical protein